MRARQFWESKVCTLESRLFLIFLGFQVVHTVDDLFSNLSFGSLSISWLCPRSLQSLPRGHGHGDDRKFIDPKR
jgi:hypothetical protein